MTCLHYTVGKLICTERWSDLPKVTPLLLGRAVVWTQAAWLQSPSTWPLCHIALFNLPATQCGFVLHTKCNLISLPRWRLLGLGCCQTVIPLSCPSQPCVWMGPIQTPFRFLAIKLWQQCHGGKGACLFNLESSEIGMSLTISLYWRADFIYFLILPFNFKKRGLSFISPFLEAPERMLKTHVLSL